MAVTRVNHCWIPMPDGSRLGARLWLPEGDQPCPAILEYIPYRKDDYSAKRDSNTIAHFAKHGYACVRVDMRGSGSSDGVLYDEYSDQEVDDGVAVIEWIAAQPWCSGKLGTMGISWGGITGLQLAQRAPEALKTIIVLGATDQRYYDDAGYYMGCMVGQTLGWAAIMFGYNTRPPDPELAGEAWLALWMDRLQNTPHYLERWLEHQHNDEYWQNNSADADYDAIQVPVYAISGHADCWPNTVPRLLQNLRVPMRGLQGAWCHRYPHLGIPGPTVDFLSDAIRWFDQWLKGDETGIMEEAQYQVFLQDSVKPQTYYDERPGHWIGLSSWPSDQIETVGFHLAPGSLSKEPVSDQSMDICSAQTTGQQSGEYMPWFSFGPAEELPGDQREEDAGSLVFDTDSLTEPLQILGNAVAALKLSSDCPQALVATRLCDVWPDGSSTLITRGILNLSQRNGKSKPELMIPGEKVAVEVELNHSAYVVPAGHRLRLAISTSYWPMAWPSPTHSRVIVYSGSSTLKLPVLGANAVNAPLTDFGESEIGEPEPTTVLRPVSQKREIKYDVEQNLSLLEIDADNGKTRFEETGIEMGSKSTYRFGIGESDPLSAIAEYDWEWEYGREDWQTRTHTFTRVTCDQSYFYLHAVSTAWEGDQQVFRKQWDRKFERDHF
ncbi:MAG: CocE/NonD family hydrolase [Gammaproteobacteria bacterium]|nr:CocE/NonD family hydrolase [Gammaproteobacteria bacterium]